MPYGYNYGGMIPQDEPVVSDPYTPPVDNRNPYNTYTPPIGGPAPPREGNGYGTGSGYGAPILPPYTPPPQYTDRHLTPPIRPGDGSGYGKIPPPYQGGPWTPGKSNITLPGFPSGGVTHPLDAGRGQVAGGGGVSGGSRSGTPPPYGGGFGGSRIAPPTRPPISPPRDVYSPRKRVGGATPISGGRRGF
jgi:hypothetical protein